MPARNLPDATWQHQTCRANFRAQAAGHHLPPATHYPLPTTQHHPPPTTTTHLLLDVAGTRQANRVRAHYLASVLSQDIPFFDGQPGGALMHALNEDMVALQHAMGEKNGTMLHYLSNFVSGVAVGELGSACAGPEGASLNMRWEKSTTMLQCCVGGCRGSSGQGDDLHVQVLKDDCTWRS